MKTLALILVLLVASMAFAPAFAVIQTFGTDKTSYKKGDKITFAGKADSDHANKMISIKIQGPSGKPFLIGGPSDFDGVFSINLDTSSTRYSDKVSQKGVYNATAFYDDTPLIQYAGKFTLFDYSQDGSPVSPSAADLMGQSSSSPPPATPNPTAPPPTTTQPPLQPPTQPPKTETPAPPPKEEPTDTAPPAENPKTVIPGFPDPKKDPQTYVDRYKSEPAFTEWFDKYFPGQSIYDVVGLPDPAKNTSTVPGFPDPSKDPQTYVDQYNNSPAFKTWFDKYFPGKTIYEVVGLPEPKAEEPKVGVCGEGTVLENGVCVVVKKSGGGCLVATAAYGTELAPQVQSLREIRDGMLLKSDSGSKFMGGFNAFYYSFSPTVADWERQSPLFRDVVKTALTPLLSSLSILNSAQIDSEQEVLGYGMGIVMLNLGMYFVLPAVVILQIRKRLR